MTRTIRKGEPVKGGAVLVHVRSDDAWQHIGAVARDMVQGKIA